MDLCLNGHEGQFALLGRSQKTLKMNVIEELYRIFGTHTVKFFPGKGELYVANRKIHVIGAHDERAEANIRGSTFQTAYIDELTLIPQSAFQILRSRVSGKDGQILATTNPDSPYHWVKTEVLDRSDEIDLKTWAFTLEDNPSLSREFKDSIRREYKGLWYRRFIEGQWVLAEGTIFDFFDEKLHVIEFPKSNARYHTIGVDYGTVNPTAFVMVGYNPDSFPHLWAEKEYYFDSRKELRQKTDTEFAHDLIKFMEGYKVKGIYVDPSAASFRAELAKLGVSSIEANNDVLDGIRFHAKLLSNGTLKICRSCKNLIKEYASYVWDEKARIRGEDEPKKENDHCFAEGTLISTLEGLTPIEDVQINSLVTTPLGYRRVLKKFVHKDEVYEYTILGKKIRCTSDHKFYTQRGWIEARDLIQSDMFLLNICEGIWPKLSKPLSLTESDIIGTYPPKICVIEDILERIKLIDCEDMDVFIKMFGNSIMEKFPMDTVFITSTGMPQIMSLAISSASQNLSIANFICEIFRKKEKSLWSHIVLKYARLQKHGMRQKREENGIDGMESRPLKKESQENIYANSAGKNISQQNIQSRDFVQITVSQNGEEIITLMISHAFANSVLRNSRQINMRKRNAARKSARGNSKTKIGSINQSNVQNVEQNLGLLDAKESIVPAPVKCKPVGRQNVYSLAVEDIHAYFAENILVLNCQDSLRYCLQTHFAPIYNGTAEIDLKEYRKFKNEWGYV
jgi:PBSX family phage terminase large subunit